MTDETARLKNRIDLALNEYLVGMEPGCGDSIAGFNAARDVVRSVLSERSASAAMMREAGLTNTQAAAVIVQNVRPLLAGWGPDVQGSVLLDLVAMWLGGHHPDIRDEVLRVFLAHLPKLIELNAPPPGAFEKEE